MRSGVNTVIGGVEQAVECASRTGGVAGTVDLDRSDCIYYVQPLTSILTSPGHGPITVVRCVVPEVALSGVSCPLSMQPPIIMFRQQIDLLKVKH